MAEHFSGIALTDKYLRDSPSFSSCQTLRGLPQSTGGFGVSSTSEDMAYCDAFRNLFSGRYSMLSYYAIGPTTWAIEA